MNNQSSVIEVKNLTKSFGGVHALADASFSINRGEVLAIAGENGAGKSTLCKTLTGAHAPDAGTIYIEGKEFKRLTPAEAFENGIAMIYQEFNLVPEMTVYENIFIGKEIRNGVVLNKKEMIRQTKELFDSMEIKIDPTAQICNLSVAYCQLVEIAKAVKENAKIIIMDEPTAPLTTKEVDMLFKLVRRLKSAGTTIIYISHRMDEITTLSDRVLIMRDGHVVDMLITKETTVPEIICKMIGRELRMAFDENRPNYKGDPEVVLRVENLTTDKISDISFELKRGEVLGLAGLVGAGRTETIRAIFGADRITSGKVFVHGKEAKLGSPKKAIQAGIGLIPEDRKREGLHLELPIRTNMSLVKVKELSKMMAISKKLENQLIDKYVDSLSIKMGSTKDNVSSLSGGNQQKVVITKWLASELDILFFDEPTRGIDVGTKSEIYELINQLRAQGKAIIVVSSEMEEILGLSDRIIVLYEGKYMGELDRKSATQESIMTLASGIQKQC